MKLTIELTFNNYVSLSDDSESGQKCQCVDKPDGSLTLASDRLLSGKITHYLCK